MSISGTALVTLDTIIATIIAGLEVGSPIELEDVLVIRRIIQDALPDFEVEAYHDHKRVIVGVGLSGIVLAKRELIAV